jgi:hypothetical protein
MKENVVEKAVRYFNECDLDRLVECWHDDIIVYNLKENTVIAKGKALMKELTMEECENKDEIIFVENTIEIGNLYIILKKSDKDKKDLSICEVENDLIKRVWAVEE